MRESRWLWLIYDIRRFHVGVILLFLFAGVWGASAGFAADSRPVRVSLSNATLVLPPGSASNEKFSLVRARLENEVRRAKAPQQKRYRRGLEHALRLCDELIAQLKPDARASLRNNLAEVLLAVANDSRPRVPRHIDAFSCTAQLLEMAHRPIGHGTTRAANIATAAGGDLSKLDPPPSSFWQKTDIGTQDLYAGFGRGSLPDFKNQVFSYSGPKDSFGRNPGIEARVVGHEYKIKFAEVSSEPFATRIFGALGFNVDVTDHAEALKIRYSRKLLTEFNSRKPLTTQFTALFIIPVYRLELQKVYDPFDFIVSAVLTNGATWSCRELKKHLLLEPHGAITETNFSPEAESQVAFLITVRANVQEKVPQEERIGPWDFNQLDHGARRELRGAGVAAAWLGWFDTRFDNTKLKIVHRRDNRQPVLQHCLSDLGGVLGETGGFMYSVGERPNAFPWTFTSPPLSQGPHRLARPLHIDGYRPVAFVAPFAEMTIDDAQWMARRIGQLREEQIVAALIASGYSAAEVRLYTEKLLARRDRMIMDFGLSRELRLLRPNGSDKTFSYDPRVDAKVGVELPDGRRVAASQRQLRVVNGSLQPFE